MWPGFRDILFSSAGCPLRLCQGRTVHERLRQESALPGCALKVIVLLKGEPSSQSDAQSTLGLQFHSPWTLPDTPPANMLLPPLIPGSLQKSHPKDAQDPIAKVDNRKGSEYCKCNSTFNTFAKNKTNMIDATYVWICRVFLHSLDSDICRYLEHRLRPPQRSWKNTSLTFY